MPWGGWLPPLLATQDTGERRAVSSRLAAGPDEPHILMALHAISPFALPVWAFGSYPSTRRRGHLGSFPLVPVPCLRVASDPRHCLASRLGVAEGEISKRPGLDVVHIMSARTYWLEPSHWPYLSAKQL